MTTTSKPRLWARSLIALGLGLAAAVAVIAFRKPGLARSTARPDSSKVGDPQKCESSRRPPKTIDPKLAIANVSSPAYDPVEVMKQDLAWAYQLFEREARDQEWATTVESELTTRIKAAFSSAPTRTLEKIDCRQSSCKIVFSANYGDDSKEAALALQRPLLASAFTLDESKVLGDRFRQEAFVLFSPEHRNPKEYRAWVEKRLSSWAAMTRKNTVKK